MDPHDLDQLFRTATQHHQAGRLDDAESGYRTFLNVQPDHPFCLQQFAMLLAQTGRVREAMPHMEKSCRLRSDIPAFWNNLGEIYRQCDRLAESQQSFHKALQLAPSFPEAHYNLGNVLKQLGQHADAITHFNEAVRLRPNYDRAWYNLGNALREEGRAVPAVDAYRKALALNDNWSDAHLNLANALFDLRRLDEAAHEYRRAAELKPDDGDLDDSLGNCLLAAGKIDEAVAVYRRANTRRPDNWLRAMRTELLAEPIAASHDAIDEYRSRISGVLSRYADRGSIDLAKLHTSGAEPPMLLAYQGRDDRPIKEQYASFFAERLPQRNLPVRRSGKPRIGFVVTHGHEGVFARCLGELVARLDRNRLDVRMVTSRSGANVVRFMMPNAQFEFVILPDPVDQADAMLRQIGFDALIYWEIGTDSMNYMLPFFRPAPLQLGCWGWPVTSGNPAVAAYLSWDALEPADGKSHYTEKLIRLRHMPVYYNRPPVPVPAPDRTQFGFSANDRVYLCQQNVRKYHPDFDAVLAGILRADPKGIIAVIADEQPAVTAMLTRRLRQTMPDVINRVRVMDRLERAPYLGLVAATDVILDTLHYGGGANTVLDAVAAATPMITQPGQFHRGRWAAAVNNLLGLAELNAGSLDVFVQTAVGFANDNERNKTIRQRIRDNGRALFENSAAVTEWEEWLINAITGMPHQRD